MTRLDVSSTDSTSGSSSSSSSSATSSSSSASSSSDSESSVCEVVATDAPAPVAPPNPLPDDKPRRASTRSRPGDSTDDDAASKPAQSTTSAPPRRRSTVASKPKVVTAAAKKPPPRPVGGGKTKPTPKPTSKGKETRGTPKKKSIFSPDNSSESDEDKPKNGLRPKVTSSSKSKGRPRKMSADNKTKPVVKKDEKTGVSSKDNKENAKKRSGSRSSGPPAKQRADDKNSNEKTPNDKTDKATPTKTRTEDKKSTPRKSMDKASVYSCSSSRSSVDTDSPDSDSEPSPRKEPPVTRTKPAPNKTPAKNTDSGENVRIDAPEAALPRKLTRSLSARNMRLLATRSRQQTDTDSDNEREKPDKPTGQGKRRRPPVVQVPRVSPAVLPEPQERRCPVRDCDSSGHLGGKLDKHFTWDACPVYHNVTPAWCVSAAEEYAAANAVRRRATLHMQQRPRTQPSIDQRAYQLKVKDLRSKWRSPSEAREHWAAAAADGLPPHGEEADREPILDGFAPDYDLKLFREAQAQAASKIEEELGDLPANRGTRYVVMGKYQMEVWYQSPYPGDAARVPRLYLCEFCLSHHKAKVGIARHSAKCAWKHPPGDEVYRKGRLSVWQVDGRKHKQYCQQLCLLAKFFLDHKTLYYDVEPFLFYVMTLADNEGCHTVGYFSKEKNSFLNYNVSCILTLPPYQRQGYGRLLIDFSYLLTKTEGKVGSPEKPLSDLGLISYRSYWKDALLKRLCSATGPTLSVRDLSRDLAVASYDIVSTLQERGLMKYWKGKHIVLKKQEVLEEFARRAERVRSVDPACLRWTPPAAPPPAR